MKLENIENNYLKILYFILYIVISKTIFKYIVLQRSYLQHQFVFKNIKIMMSGYVDKMYLSTLQKHF